MMIFLIVLQLVAACAAQQPIGPPYSQIIVSAPDSAAQRENFWVGIRLADGDGQPMADLAGHYVTAAANRRGVLLPPGDILIEKGQGGFWARSEDWLGDGLAISVLDQHQTTGVSPNISVRLSPDASDLERQSAALALLKQRPPTWQNMEELAQKYTDLYLASGERQYLVDQIAALEKYRAAFPEDQRLLYRLARALDELDADPAAAIRHYRAAAGGWERRLRMYYQNAMRVEFYHPGTMGPDQLDAFFAAWSADLDSLRAALGPPSQKAHRRHFLQRAGAEYHLWRAETALARDGDPAQARQWLRQAQAASPPDRATADAYFDIYIHPRAELRLGDIARAHGEPQAARKHYRAAWALLKRHEGDWSRERAHVYPDLRELALLGRLAKERIAP